MHAVLLGGPPGVGKTTVAREWLAIAATGSQLAQWVDVDDLWRHQPWRVDDVTRSMVRANLAAVINNAAEAGVTVLLITWVFQDPVMQQLVRDLLPPGCLSTTVQLRVSEQVWRSRFTADALRPPIDGFFEARYLAAQAVAADHLIDANQLEAATVARQLAAAIGIP